MSSEIVPTRGYLICCIERTGSNLLADALVQTRVAGRPMEYFSPALQEAPWMRSILDGSNVISGLSKIIAAATSSNGVFGSKLHWTQLRYLAKTLENASQGLPQFRQETLPEFLSELPKLMPTAEFLALLRSRAATRPGFEAAYQLFADRIPDLRIVWLRRKNMVARAISHYRALHSNVWHQSTPTGESSSTDPTLRFDLAQIHQNYCLGLFQEESWQWLFDKRGIQPHSVTYEDLVADYETTVRGVLKFLDLDAAVEAIPPVKSIRQADALSAEWEQEYLKTSLA